MSYSALGETKDWWGCNSSASEVYVFRSVLKNAEMRSPKDALLFVRPIGNGAKWGVDVRSVLVKPIGDGQWSVDVVMTLKLGNPWYMWCMPPIATPPTAKDLAKLVIEDSEFQARFPDAALGGYEQLQLTGPPQAVEFWLAHHLLWDAGKPTQKYGKVDGVYWGQADDAPNVKPWALGEAPLGPVDKVSSTGGSKIVAGMIAGGIVIAAIWFSDKSEGKKR